MTSELSPDESTAFWKAWTASLEIPVLGSGPKRSQALPQEVRDTRWCNTILMKNLSLTAQMKLKEPDELENWQGFQNK